MVSTVDDVAIPDALKANRWTAPHTTRRALTTPMERLGNSPQAAAAPPASASASASAARLVYKIGDLGHVTSMETPRLQEGDCRYMAPELLNDDARDLPRADVFSLGLSVYELARHVPLPKNGGEWQALRAGNVPRLPGTSDEFNDILQVRA